MTPQVRQAFSQLGDGTWFDNVSDVATVLKGTPFYTKRTTLKASQLPNKPFYREMTLLNKIAVAYGIPEREWAKFIVWVQEPIDDFDRRFDEVKRFLRTYGSDYTYQRLLLTTHNAIDLYIKQNK